MTTSGERVTGEVPVAQPFEDRLWALAQAAVDINAERTVDDILLAVTRHARRIVSAHVGATSLTVEGSGAEDGWRQQRTTVSRSRDYPAVDPAWAAPLHGLVCDDNDVACLTRAEILAHTLWESPDEPPVDGWLAAPLVGSDGANLGILQVGQRVEGHFDGADEAILVQLAQLASSSIEKAKLADERDLQAERLRGLADAAVAISSPLGTRELLERITRVATELIGAHQGVASLTAGTTWEQAITAVSLSERYEPWRDYAAIPDGSGIYARVTENNHPLRLTQEELEAHPDWRGFGEEMADHPPMRGWVAVPFVSASGENLGLLQLSDRFEGDFTEEDEALLSQLAQLASVAIENAQLQEELVRQERQQLTQDLLAGLSHDMQTPLAVILGLATELAHLAPEDEDLRLLTDLLQTHAQRLRQLVQQFLDYVRLEAGELPHMRREPVVAHAVIQETVELFAGHGRVDLTAAEDLPRVLGDQDRLVQVLANLINNAVKFSDGPVRVHARPDTEGTVRIEVEDEGPGIPTTERELVFDKLYRGEHAHRSRLPGQGIGLYVSRTLTEAMGGALTLDEVEHGTRVVVHLPAAPTPD
jgi:signal transduction histidine kinase